MEFDRPHHQEIARILASFNAPLFEKAGLYFGGGTRIALEIDEFRVSVDIDIVCLTSDSYRAVRQQVTQSSLGDLVSNALDLPRGVRTDRDAVRTMVNMNGTHVKLEFIRFEGYSLSGTVDQTLFPIPSLDRISCFTTKLLANADRYTTNSKKDVIDILAMTLMWGDIPQAAISMAEDIYSRRVVMPNLLSALAEVNNDAALLLTAGKNIGINSQWIDRLQNQAGVLYSQLLDESNDSHL